MPTVFVPNHAGIQSMATPGGHVYRFTRRMGRNTSALARRYVHVRTGELKREIQDPEIDVGINRVTARVWSMARHSLWYHEGTRTPITRPGGGLMPIHNATRTRVIARKAAVRGQRPKPFLADALRDAFLIEMGRR